ncbi:DUF6701 domain-containing protein [Uliginosibacterium sp. H3]|uniref:DUF6701 domain-containing protein n=1 Tax=Uliginosibacterium silvisoli TaxID=3114758 RepID=A0ABU6K3R5_9RHOO|nr:DUF6701 domain-containing protein [Uliginosibacterium sp. H3]
MTGLLRLCAQSLFLLIGLLYFGQAVAAITVTAGNAESVQGNASMTPSPPSGMGSGNVLIAQVVAKSAATITPPSGWTEISKASVNQSGSIQQRIYFRNLTAAAASSYTWAITGAGSSDRSDSVIYGLTGATAADCGAANTTVCAGAYQAGGGNQVTAPNVQSQPPTYPAGSLRMAFFGVNDGSPTITPAAQNSATLGVYDRAGSGSTGVGIHATYYVMPSADNGSQQSATIGGNANNIGSTFIITASSAPPVTIDHIQIEINGTPLTCTPSTVTVKACTNASCSTQSGTSTTVTLSATSGTLGSTSLTFTGTGTTTLAKTTVGTTTLSATSSPAASGSTTCLLNGATAASCQYTFDDSGLLLTIPTQKAGWTSSATPAPDNTFSVRAVKAGTTAASACVPAFANVTRAVKFWWNYAQPSTGTKTLTVNGNSTVVRSATSTAGSTSATGTSLNLSFDSTGTASGLTLNYADAGQLTLNARYDGSASNGDTNLVMTGSTDFVTVPYALCVDSADTNWNCTAADTSCTKFRSAGAAFNLTVTGKAYGSGAVCSLPTTPNYAQSGLALTSTVVAPSGGANAAMVPASIDIPAGGTMTQANQTLLDVGIFTITATPPANAYFGATVPAGTSGNSGRFVPAGFDITIPTYKARSDFTCSGPNSVNSAFSYLGEPVTSAFTLKAVAVGGTTTSNYTGNFARFTLPPLTATPTNWTGLAVGAQAGASLLNPSATASASRMTVACTGCTSSGNNPAKLVNGTASLSFTLTPLRPYNTFTPDGPYAAIFTLAARDTDGVGMLTPAYDWDGSGGNDAVSIGDMSTGVAKATTLYFGRMRIDNAYGSSLQGLPVSAYVQYWNGTYFVKHTADSCTQITVPATTSVPTPTSAASLYCNGGVGLYGGLTGVAATVNGTTAGNTVTLSSGVLGGTSGLALSKPTNSGGGYLDLALLVPDYLKYNVDGIDQSTASCTASPDFYLHDDNPRARIRFGTRTNDKVIYLREVY